MCLIYKNIVKDITYDDFYVIKKISQNWQAKTRDASWPCLWWAGEGYEFKNQNLNLNSPIKGEELDEMDDALDVFPMRFFSVYKCFDSAKIHLQHPHLTHIFYLNRNLVLSTIFFKGLKKKIQ